MFYTTAAMSPGLLPSPSLHLVCPTEHMVTYPKLCRVDYVVGSVKGGFAQQRFNDRNEIVDGFPSFRLTITKQALTGACTYYISM